jgi:hypothetical protein
MRTYHSLYVEYAARIVSIHAARDAAAAHPDGVRLAVHMFEDELVERGRLAAAQARRGVRARCRARARRHARAREPLLRRNAVPRRRAIYECRALKWRSRGPRRARTPAQPRTSDPEPILSAVRARAEQGMIEGRRAAVAKLPACGGRRA